jgi:hypothetical protein
LYLKLNSQKTDFISSKCICSKLKNFKKRAKLSKKEDYRRSKNRNGLFTYDDDINMYDTESESYKDYLLLLNNWANGTGPFAEEDSGSDILPMNFE